MNTHQIIYFESGFKKTVFNIVGVREGEFVHLQLKDGRKLLINRNKVNMIEIINEDMAEKTWGEQFGVYSANDENRE